jgi:hypothetical protein
MVKRHPYIRYLRKDGHLRPSAVPVTTRAGDASGEIAQQPQPLQEPGVPGEPIPGDPQL